MKIYEDYPTQIEYNGVSYQLDLSTKNMLIVCDTLEDDILTPAYKTKIALDILVNGKHPVDDGLLGAIFKKMFPKQKKNDPVIDFEMDAALILSAFWQAYGIDLKNEADTLHFCAFMDLLSGIPKTTRLAERIDLRMMPIPEPTKYNAKQRARIIEAKAKVAIHKKADQYAGLYALYSGMTAMLKDGG